MGADFYFFTDANQPASNPAACIAVQTSANDYAYGPVIAPVTPPLTPVAAGKDEYRVTSLHKANFDPTAYAVCDAIACVQRVPPTTPAAPRPLVNIILKPLVQPALNFAAVKYIIYKGVLEESLIDANETDVATPTNNQLTKLLWEVQQRKNTSAGTPNVKAPADALGAGLTGAGFADTDPIDNLFYRTGVAFQLPAVKGGWTIGQFDKAQFGIDVLMDGIAFPHPLGLARKIEHRVSATTLVGGENEAQKFDHWHDKEQILGFMDPCAFYGSFFRAGVQAKTSGNVPFAKKAGVSLYQEVLFPFVNRNKVYLDIRNEHNFSLGYFKNYQKTAGTVTSTYVKLRNNEIDYYGNKWPLLTLTTSNFASNTAAKPNSFTLQLPVGDNPTPLIYVSQGYRDLNAKGGFPPELKDPDRFVGDFKPPVGGYTVTKNSSGSKSLVLVVPNIPGQGATTPVSCCTRLKYFKQQAGTPIVSTAIQSANYLDNLFYPLDLAILLEGPAGTKIKSAVYDEETYVNAKNLPRLGFDFVGKIGIARDSNNTSFFVLPTTVRTQAKPASVFVTLEGETSDYAGSYPEFVALHYPLQSVKKRTLLFSGTNQVVVAKFSSDATAEQQSRFNTPDFDKFFLITIANGTFDTWKGKVTAAQGAGFRTFLGVTNLQSPDNGQGVKYTSFDLVLRVYVLDSSTGKYNIQDIATVPASTTANVTVYTDASA